MGITKQNWVEERLFRHHEDAFPSKSLQISHAVGNFYGTGFEIWAGLGPVGITEKKSVGPIMSNF